MVGRGDVDAAADDGLAVPGLRGGQGAGAAEDPGEVALGERGERLDPAGGGADHDEVLGSTLGQISFHRTVPPDDHGHRRGGRLRRAIPRR